MPSDCLWAIKQTLLVKPKIHVKVPVNERRFPNMPSHWLAAMLKTQVD